MDRNPAYLQVIRKFQSLDRQILFSLLAQRWYQVGTYFLGNVKDELHYSKVGIAFKYKKERLSALFIFVFFCFCSIVVAQGCL